MNRLLAGALSGTLATVPMTATMLGLFSTLPKTQQYNLPPRQISEELSYRAGYAYLFDEQRMKALALLAHFAYGAATGALYAAFTGPPRRPLRTGSAYGLLVWGASYLGWIPAASILKPATTQPPARRRLMLISHVVWGAGTLLTYSLLCRERRE